MGIFKKIGDAINRGWRKLTGASRYDEAIDQARGLFYQEQAAMNERHEQERGIFARGMDARESLERLQGTASGAGSYGSQGMVANVNAANRESDRALFLGNQAMELRQLRRQHEANEFQLKQGARSANRAFAGNMLQVAGLFV